MFAIECADLEGKSGTLKRRQLQAARWRPGAFADEAAMEALKAVQPRAEIIVERNQERAALGGAVLDDPKSMATIPIVDQEMTTVIRVGACPDRQERVEIDGMRD